MKTVGRSPASRTAAAQEPVLERVGWAALLLLVALLPLATSIAPGATGPRSLTEDAYNVPKLLLLAVLFTVSAVAWASSLARGETALRTGPSHYALAAFAGLVALSTALGLEPLSSLFGASGLASGAITWLLCCGATFLLGQYVSGGRRLRQLAWSAVAGSTVVGFIVLLQSAGLDPLRTPFNPSNLWLIERGPATLGNPDNTGLALTAPAILAVALALTEKSKANRVWAAACAATIAGAAFVTLTRAAWVGIVIGLILLFSLAPKKREGGGRNIAIGAGVAVAIVVVGSLLAGPEALLGRFATLSAGLDAFSSGRLTMWSDTLRTVANYPLFGTGADRLALGAYEVQTKVVTEGVNRYVIQDPHSLPLLIAGQFGIPALLAFASLVGIVLVQAWRLVRGATSSTTSTGGIYAGWFAATIGFLAAAALSVFTVSPIFTTFLTLGALSAPALRTAEKRAWVTAVSCALVAALSLVGLYGAVQGYRASRHVMLSTLSDSQFHLEEAMRLTPWDTRTRVTYQWRKIGAFKSSLTSPDVALSHATADSFDTEIRMQILRAPRELLWYRMLVDLHRIPEGSPGYRPEKVLEAIDVGLEAFPNDPEFTQWRSDLGSGEATVTAPE